MTKDKLLDIWRTLNHDTLRFTWYRRKPSLIQVRLDYILILSTFEQHIEYVGINPVHSDHAILYLCLSLAQNSRKSGYWKLNASVLRDLEYSMKVSEIIREALGEEVSDIKHKWESMKLKVHGYTLQFANRKAKSSRQVLLALEKKLKQLEQSPHSLFTQDNTNEQIILV